MYASMENTEEAAERRFEVLREWLGDSVFDYEVDGGRIWIGIGDRPNSFVSVRRRGDENVIGGKIVMGGIESGIGSTPLTGFFRRSDYIELYFEGNMLTLFRDGEVKSRT